MQKIFLILGFFVSFPLFAQQNWQDKIDTEVWAEALGNAEFEVFVLLKDQANTQAAKSLKAKEEKAFYVYNASAGKG
jgi:hypothetical protein